MRHSLALILYVAAAASGLGGLRVLWRLAQTPTPDPPPGEVRAQFPLGEATPRGDRLRLASAGLLGLAAVLAVMARWLTRPAA